MSISDYAKHRGCSAPNVHKAIKAGKIKDGLKRTEAGEPYIIPEVADREWAKNFNPTRIQNEELADKLSAGLAVPATPQAVEVAKELAAKPAPRRRAGGDEDDEDASLLAEDKEVLASIKKQKAFYQAESARLDYEEKAGLLVEKAKVHKAFFAFGQAIRARILAVPDRDIDAVVNAATRAEARQILLDRLTDALMELTTLPEQIPQ